MAKFPLGKPVTTETATVEVDAGLAVGAHRFRLSVVNAAGLPSRAADEVVVQVTQSRVVLPPIGPPIAPPIGPPISPPVRPAGPVPPLEPMRPTLPAQPAQPVKPAPPLNPAEPVKPKRPPSPRTSRRPS